MSDTICIPKEKYDYLLKCEKIVNSEFNEKFSKKFIDSVKESEEDYNKGIIKIVKNSKERKILFDSL